MKVSRHAKQRLKEREGCGKSKADRKAQLALDRGYRHCQTKGELKKYLSELWAYNETANGLRVYGEKIYVFSGYTLVTILTLPQKFRKNLRAYIKEGE